MTVAVRHEGVGTGASDLYVVASEEAVKASIKLALAVAKVNTQVIRRCY